MILPTSPPSPSEALDHVLDVSASMATQPGWLPTLLWKLVELQKDKCEEDLNHFTSTVIDSCFDNTPPQPNECKTDYEWAHALMKESQEEYDKYVKACRLTKQLTKLLDY